MSESGRKNNITGIIMSACLLIIAAVCAVIIVIKDRTPGNIVRIYSGGTLLGTYDTGVISGEIFLTVIPESEAADAQIIEGIHKPEEGNYNIIRISGSGVSVKDTDCPTKLCMHMGEISTSGIPLVCLPHRLVITIESSTESDTDAWTY